MLSHRGFDATAVSVRPEGKNTRQKRAAARAPSPSSRDATLTRERMLTGGAAAGAPSAALSAGRLREQN